MFKTPPKTLTIIDMLNKIRASNKPLLIETINQPPLHLEDKLTPRHAINDVASDDNGTYLLHTASAAHKVSPEGVMTTDEHEEVLNLATISRIILA
jgi:hypothetical protein